MKRWGLAVVVVVMACTVTQAADPTPQDQELEHQQQERLKWVASVLEKEGSYGMLFVTLTSLFIPR